MQLDINKMGEARVYDILGKPKIWHLDGPEVNSGRWPRYLVQPGDISNLEEIYRTGKIAIDSFSASHRQDDTASLKPQIFNTHYTAPEIRFLNKSSGFSSDIWALAGTIHLIRTTKLLLARLESRSSLVSWLAWAHGPFRQDYWKAVGEYLSTDSTVPVFTVNTIPQKPTSKTKEQPKRLVGSRSEPYPREWGFHRDKVVALLLGEEETPWSIRQRKKLQHTKDRSKYLRIKLPKNSSVWARFQEQRKRITGFHSLLHEDLSKERQWYQETDGLNGEEQYTPPRRPDTMDDATIKRLNNTWNPKFARGIDPGQAPEEQGGGTDMPDEEIAEHGSSSAKRPLAEDDQEALPNPKKAKTFVPEHNLRDQVERVEQDDGVTKFSYCLQAGEVERLADLLGRMLKNDPDERINTDAVLQHQWFHASKKRAGNMYPV
jgi:serine/threonine protein kinase